MIEYRTLVADPPWAFGDKLGSRGAAGHYSTLTVDEICAFPLPPLAADCYLFLWRVSSQVPEAYRVAAAWGFVAKTELVWRKTTKTGKRWFGLGRHLRAEHETCIVAARGRPAPLRRDIRSTFSAQAGRHSEKPDRFYEIVEAFSPGPRFELFARRARADWTCQFGSEL